MSRGFYKQIQPDGDRVDPKADGSASTTSTPLGSTELNGSISSSDTTITVDSTSGFPTSGHISIEDEIIEYTGKTATTFTGCTRGDHETTAASHSDNDTVAGVYVSNWIDSDGWATLEVFIQSPVISKDQGIIIEYTDDANVANPSIKGSRKFQINAVDVARGFKDIRATTLLDGFRVKYINGSEPQSTFFLQTTLRVSPESGLFNTGNAQVTADFLREVALENVSNYSTDTKFGRNPSISTGTTPEDVWNGGGTYTGFNATQNENLSTASSSANDVGGLRASGTVTTTSSTKLIDSSATFITNNVAVGDIVLNDSRGIHGIITSVDSETQVTIFDMRDTTNGQYFNVAGNSYRIAYSNGTGAAVVEWTNILNSDFEIQTNVFVILNGTSSVTTTGNFYRLSRGKILLAGSGGKNDGAITCRQATTTANIFAVMPVGFNQTSIAGSTVPKNKLFLIESLKVNILVGNGTSGAGVVTFKARPYGQAFNSIRVYAVSTGGGIDEDLKGGIILNTGTDYKFTVESVTDNSSQVTASVEYLEIDRES